MSQPLDINRNVTKSYISLGGNAASIHGDVAHTLKFAVSCLSIDSVNVLQTSAFFATPAYPIGSGPDFVNAVVAVETTLNAVDFLAFLHSIEELAGRKRDIRWGQRTLDLDLISHGDVISPSIEGHEKWVNLSLDRQLNSAPEKLILPHPRLQDRAFVLIPLRAVSPDWTHPVTGRTVTQLINALPAGDVAGIKPL